MIKLTNTIKVSDIKSFFMQEFTIPREGGDETVTSLAICMNEKYERYEMLRRPKLVKSGNKDSYTYIDEPCKVQKDVTFVIKEDAVEKYYLLMEKFEALHGVAKNI
jgi:hypothetical protein